MPASTAEAITRPAIVRAVRIVEADKPFLRSRAPGRLSSKSIRRIETSRYNPSSSNTWSLPTFSYWAIVFGASPACSVMFHQRLYCSSKVILSRAGSR